MAILATTIIIRMVTYLEDEEWVWYKIFSGMLLIFSIPFTFCSHDHPAPTCYCFGDGPKPEVAKQNQVARRKPSNKSKKQPEFGLIKKVKESLGFGESRQTEESSEESSSSSIFKKKKPKSKRKLKRSTKKKQPVSGLMESSTESESSSSSTKVTEQKRKSPGKTKKSEHKKTPLSSLIVKEEPKETTIVVEEEIFKGSDVEEDEGTVEAKLIIKKKATEENKFNYDLILDIDPDEDDHMSVDVHGQVDGGEMTVATHAATEGEGKVDVVAEIQYGDKMDKDEVVMIVSSESSSSSDEMKLRAGEK